MLYVNIISIKLRKQNVMYGKSSAKFYSYDESKYQIKDRHVKSKIFKFAEDNKGECLCVFKVKGRISKIKLIKYKSYKKRMLLLEHIKMAEFCMTKGSIPNFRNKS